MLKQLTAIVFLLSFAMQTFNSAFIVVDYFANTKAFSKYCENKATPRMQCNGKCQMMKKIKEEGKKDQQNAERKSENKNEVVLSSKSFYPFLRLSVSTHSNVFARLSSPGTIEMPRALLRPPIC